MTFKPIPARVPYYPPQIGGKFDAQTARTELAKISRAIAPTQTRTVVVNATVAATDDTLLVNTTSGNLTVTLLPAAQVMWLRVQIKNTGTHVAIVSGTVDGIGSMTLGPEDAIVIQSDGVSWRLLDSQWSNVIVFPERFGAKGDNVTNDSVALLAAWNALPATGGVLWLTGRYAVLTALVFTGKTNVTIDGPGSINGAGLANGSTVLTIGGTSYGTSSTMSATIAQGVSAFAVASAATLGVVAGDWVSLVSTEPNSEINALYVKGELSQVDTVAVNTLNLKHATKLGYTVGGGGGYVVTVTRFNVVSRITLQFKGGIIGGGAGKGHIGVEAQYAVGVDLNIPVDACETTGLDAAYCARVKFGAACRVTGATDLVTPAGYAFSISSLTEYVGMDKGCYAENFRIAFTTASYLPVFHYAVAGEFVHSVGNNAAVQTHNNGLHGSFTDLQIDDAYTGIGAYGKYNIVSNCQFRNVRTFCVDIGGDGPIQTLVTGCVGRAAAGVNVQSYAGASKTDVVVDESNVWVAELVGGAIVDAGVSCSLAGAKVSSRVRGFSPGFRVQASDIIVENPDIADVVAGSGNPFGIHITNNAANVAVRGGRIRSEITPQMTNGIVITAGCTNTLIERVKNTGWTGSAVSDSGAGTTQIAYGT